MPHFNAGAGRVAGLGLFLTFASATLGTAQRLVPNQFDTTVPRTWLCNGSGCVQYVGFGLTITGTSGAVATSCTFVLPSEPYWFDDSYIQSECMIEVP